MTHRFGSVLVLAALLLAIAAPTAHANLLNEEDSTELAQQLADATEEQGVCYGWTVSVDDQGGSASSLEQGSSFGPDTALEDSDTGDCSALVQLNALVTYTSELDEAEDRAELRVVSDEGSIDQDAVERLGYDAGDLLGDDDDVALFNVVAGLPLLAAEAGLADPVPFEPPTQDERSEAAGEGPTNSPGSDWWRMYWWVPVLGIPVALVAALMIAAWLYAAVTRHRSRSSASQHDRTP